MPRRRPNPTDVRTYPKAGRYVDGLLVRDHVPNLSSIDGYFSDSETLRGVRVVPMSDFGGPRSVFYARDDFERSERLAEAIAESEEINPLIIGVDAEGPFILEGAHRFVALYYLKKRQFPAIVVVDLESMSRRNPAALVSYQSKVAVSDPGLSPLEATLVLGGLLLVAGGVTYLWLKPATSVASSSQPVPVPSPVQPVYNPSSPGY